jgi:hypothetical protein
VLKTRDLDAFFRKKFLTKNILKYIPKTVTQVMAFFKSCTVAFQTRLRQAAEILQRVPVRHDWEGISQNQSAVYASNNVPSDSLSIYRKRVLIYKTIILRQTLS